MNEIQNQVFICFAAEDRYSIAEPLVFHLKNYGINVWYDRQRLVMGDNRIEKNINEGAKKSQYAITIISDNTADSKCAMEELSIIEYRYRNEEITIFPVLYEIIPQNIPSKLCWIKELIFKEADRGSGTRDICNHIACKVTEDIKQKYKFKTINDILYCESAEVPKIIHMLLLKYKEIDISNLISRVTLLYTVYLIASENLTENSFDSLLVQSVFERLFSETRLNITVDYRELWLLENALCIWISYIFTA